MILQGNFNLSKARNSLEFFDIFSIKSNKESYSMVCNTV
jgi:hypothetical protein